MVGHILFSFSYHEVTLFEKKCAIKLNYFNFHVPFKTSYELGQVHEKLKCRDRNCSLY